MICPNCGKDTAKSFEYIDVVGYDCTNCGIHVSRPKDKNMILPQPYTDNS